MLFQVGGKYFMNFGLGIIRLCTSKPSCLWKGSRGERCSVQLSGNGSA